MTEVWEAPLRAAVALQHDETVALLQRLVRIPSVNPKFVADPAQNREPEVQDAIEAELRALGFATERSHSFPDRPNLYGIWAGSQARSLALCGHIDVVPAGDGASWTTDPFGAEIRDGRLYGRGAGDMKAGLAAWNSTRWWMRRRAASAPCRPPRAPRHRMPCWWPRAAAALSVPGPAGWNGCAW